MEEKKSPFTWSENIRKDRSVYRFGGPWIRMVGTIAPWLSAIILIGMLFVVNHRIAITPGVLFDMPPAPFLEGSHSGLTVLMFSVSRETQTGEETLVFFDDERYLMQDADQIAHLADRISESISIGRHQEMLLLADKRVPHGDVMSFVNMARQAGATRINVAEKPE